MAVVAAFVMMLTRPKCDNTSTAHLAPTCSVTSNPVDITTLKSKLTQIASKYLGTSTCNPASIADAWSGYLTSLHSASDINSGSFTLTCTDIAALQGCTQGCFGGKGKWLPSFKTSVNDIILGEIMPKANAACTKCLIDKLEKMYTPAGIIFASKDIISPQIKSCTDC